MRYLELSALGPCIRIALGDITPTTLAVRGTRVRVVLRSRNGIGAGSQSDAAPPAKLATIIVPAAFGLQPLAPIRRLGDDGLPQPGTGRYGSRSGDFPPSPRPSLRVDSADTHLAG